MTPLQTVRHFLLEHKLLVPDVLQILGPVEELPSEHRSCKGSVLIVLSVAAFLAIFLFSWFDETTTRFLSPMDTHQQTADPFCETIELSNSGLFYLSEDGYWEGETEFEYSNAVYMFSGE
jgi:hypothetical protein